MRQPAPRPALTFAPPPPAPVDPTIAETARAWEAFAEERKRTRAATETAAVLAATLGARDATIAALTTRLAARTDLCWGLGVAVGCLLLLFVLRLLGGT